MSHSHVPSSPGLSRRDFLKRSGAAALAGLGTPGIVSANTQQPIADFAAHPAAGRLFDLTEIRAAPDAASTVIGQLLPNSVTSIAGLSDDSRWFEVHDKAGRGYISRASAQPILPYSRPALVDEIGSGFWAEVVAPYSTVRQWCATAAPIIDSLGFGAVVYVMDRIVAHGQVWYGVTSAPGESLIGWAAGLHYAPVNRSNPLSDSVSNSIPSSMFVLISSQNAELRVIDGSRVVMRTPILGLPHYRGATTLSAIQPGGPVSDRRLLGLSWLMQLGSGQSVHGVFWHNDFGIESDNTDVLKLPVLAARWLYALLSQPLRAVVE